MKTLVLICGASRSGTTFLLDLLKGHRQLSVFPTESKLYYHWNRNNLTHSLGVFFLVEYFKTEEVKSFVDAEYRAKRREYYKNMYDTKSPLDSVVLMNQDRFKLRFREALADTGRLGLFDCYNALFCAAKLKRDVIVVKSPMINDLGAYAIARGFNERGWNVKCIFMVRDPRFRYLSRKLQLLDKSWCIKYNRGDVDFVSHIAFESAFSINVADVNKRAGIPMATVWYEGLVDHREDVMRRLAQFLEIDFNGCLLKQKNAPISTFQKVSDSLNEIEARFYLHTNSAERKIIRFLTYQAANAYGYPIKAVDWITEWDCVKHMRYENPLDYYKHRKHRILILTDGYEKAFTRLREQYVNAFLMQGIYG